MTFHPDPMTALVPEPEDGKPTDVIIFTTEQWNAFQTERRHDRRTRFLQSILLAIAVAAALWLTRQSYFEERDRKELTRGNRALLQNIDRQTSPAAQAARDAALQRIIITVDCNGRRAMEEALNDISTQRPELFGSIALTDNCPPTP